MGLAVKQYKYFQTKYPKHVIFMQMGDFYEVIGDKAGYVAKLLDVVLAQRDNLPMCGVAYHQLDASIKLLLKAGQYMAIVELTSKPLDALIKRDIVRLIDQYHPGTA
jgi:DNA mismatch repair protein MutS